MELRWNPGFQGGPEGGVKVESRCPRGVPEVVQERARVVLGGPRAGYRARAVLGGPRAGYRAQAAQVVYPGCGTGPRLPRWCTPGVVPDQATLPCVHPCTLPRLPCPVYTLLYRPGGVRCTTLLLTGCTDGSLGVTPAVGPALPDGPGKVVQSGPRLPRRLPRGGLKRELSPGKPREARKPDSSP